MKPLSQPRPIDDRIFYCLLVSVAALQVKDVSTSFLFVGDLNGQHQEWLGSTTTNRHGVAAFDFATVSGCDQLVVCAYRKVFLKHQVNWNTVCGEIRELPWHNLWLSDNPVEVLNEHLSLLVGRYVPAKVIRVTRINLGLMINAGMLLASSRRLIFRGPVIALGLTGKSWSAVK